MNKINVTVFPLSRRGALVHRLADAFLALPAGPTRADVFRARRFRPLARELRRLGLDEQRIERELEALEDEIARQIRAKVQAGGRAA